MNQELFFSILNFPVVTFAIHSTVGKKPESIQDPNICKSDKDFKEKKNFYIVGVYLRCCVISDNESQKITAHSAGLRLFIGTIY